jgi:hypothetical protein
MQAELRRTIRSAITSANIADLHSEMIPAADPAARLFNLLSAAAESAKRLNPKGQQPGKARARDVWRDVLDAESSSDAQLLEKLAAVYRLPSEIRDRVALLPDVNSDQLVEWLPEIESVFTAHGLASNWSQYSQPITPTAMYGLKTCSNLLNAPGRDPELSNDVLGDLVHRARELLDDVLAAPELDDDVRSFLAESLVDVLRALEDYKISGIVVLDRAVDASAGRFVRSDMSRAEKTEPGNRVLRFLGGLLLLLNVMHTGHAVVDEYTNRLPWSVAPETEVLPEEARPKALPPGTPALAPPDAQASDDQ